MTNEAVVAHSDAESRSINPATGLLIERFTDHTSARVEDILNQAVAAQAAWRKMPIERRASAFAGLAELLHANRVRLAHDITTEMGKPILEALAEVDKCATHCRWYADNGAAILRDRPTTVEGSRAYVAQRPIGIVLGIMPWNFPLWQALRAAVPIMINGNGFVLKHARNVMRSALSLEALFRECDMPQGCFSVLNIDQRTTMGVLADDRIAAVTLTGSARAGAAVAAQAGALLKKSLLELGGSDPFIVLGDADVDTAAAIGVRARFQNTGQVCIAAKRFILEASIADEFVDRLVEGVKRLRTGDPNETATDLGPMARPDLRDELHGQIGESIEAGARLLVGGQPIAGAGNFYAPTILSDVTPGMRVFDEETFGPCAAVTVARDAEHAVALANQSKYGLNASLWTADPSTAARLVPSLECGGVFVNGYPTSDPRVPIGGVKRSGYGRELSHFGVSEFANVQTVWQDRI